MRVYAAPVDVNIMGVTGIHAEIRKDHPQRIRLTVTSVRDSTGGNVQLETEIILFMRDGLVNIEQETYDD